MISDTKKFIFIHIPKTAGSSLTDALSHYSRHKVIVMDSSCGPKQGRDFTDKKVKHATAIYAREKYCHEVFDSYLKFSIVRNPWDRLISYYFWDCHNKLHKNGLQYKNYPPQCHFICDDDGSLMTDVILRYENLEADTKSLFSRLDIEYTGLKIINKSKRTHYRDYYDDNLRDWVAHHYAKEIEMFGYEF